MSNVPCYINLTYNMLYKLLAFYIVMGKAISGYSKLSFVFVYNVTSSAKKQQMYQFSVIVIV